MNAKKLINLLANNSCFLVAPQQKDGAFFKHVLCGLVVAPPHDAKALPFLFVIPREALCFF